MSDKEHADFVAVMGEAKREMVKLDLKLKAALFERNCFEKDLMAAKELLEGCAVSFDWISMATNLAEIQEYARNNASLIRTGELPPREKP